jgi:hypothetical protein
MVLGVVCGFTERQIQAGKISRCAPLSLWNHRTEDGTRISSRFRAAPVLGGVAIFQLIFDFDFDFDLRGFILDEPFPKKLFAPTSSIAEDYCCCMQRTRTIGC